MSQLDLYAPRVSAVTRRAAHRAIREGAPTLREKVFAAVERAGVHGMTAQELERELGMPGNTVRPRLVELAKAGRIAESGNTRPTLSGRFAAVWVAGVGHASNAG